ncbi:hypothetical protein C8Q72DRAFT_892221 [Fomitopsis betulina]|nr:hypothetical protein C8Q72DRAFT_892221 [Fomitopsis betulina]
MAARQQRPSAPRPVQLLDPVVSASSNGGGGARSVVELVWHCLSKPTPPSFLHLNPAPLVTFHIRAPPQHLRATPVAALRSPSLRRHNGSCFDGLRDTPPPSTCHDPPHPCSTPAVALRRHSGLCASMTCKTCRTALHPPRPCTCRDRPDSRAAPAPPCDAQPAMTLRTCVQLLSPPLAARRFAGAMARASTDCETSRRPQPAATATPIRNHPHPPATPAAAPRSPSLRGRNGTHIDGLRNKPRHPPALLVPAPAATVQIRVQPQHRSSHGPLLCGRNGTRVDSLRDKPLPSTFCDARPAALLPI